MMLFRTLTLLAGVALAAPATAQTPPQQGDALDAELDELERMAPPAPKPQPKPKPAPPRAPSTAATTSAESDRVDASDDGEVEVAKRWYGGYTLGVDGASLLVFLVAGSSDSAGLGTLGVAGYVFGGPIVHAVHGNGGRALGSLGLRIGLPLVGAAVGASSESDCDSDAGFCLGQAALGFGMGMLGAMLIDAIAIARDTVPRESPATEIGLTLARDQAMLVASGRF
jgi:hypothetical protein